MSRFDGECFTVEGKEVVPLSVAEKVVDGFEFKIVECHREGAELTERLHQLEQQLSESRDEAVELARLVSATRGDLAPTGFKTYADLKTAMHKKARSIIECGG